MKNNWKTLEQKIVFKDYWFQVRKDKVIKPDGKKGFYSLIESINGVSVIALTSKQEIYLINEWKYPINDDFYTVVCDGVEKGETALVAGKRELAEEAGIKAKKWKSLGYFYPSGAILTQKVHVFLAQNLSEVKKSPDPTEKIYVKKVPLKEAVRMVMNGEITDSFAITAILKTHILINE